MKLMPILLQNYPKILYLIIFSSAAKTILMYQEMYLEPSFVCSVSPRKPSQKFLNT